jgi:hypothetical protein
MQIKGQLCGYTHTRSCAPHAPGQISILAVCLSPDNDGSIRQDKAGADQVVASEP